MQFETQIPTSNMKGQFIVHLHEQEQINSMQKIKKIIATNTFGICDIFPIMQPDVHHEHDHPRPMLFEKWC